MRIALAIAAGLLWAGAAYAQTPADLPHAGSIAQSAPEPSSSQAQSPATTNDQTSPNAGQGQATDTNHQVVCHSTVEVGSRLARHATRICKTRQQWELEQQQNQEAMRHMGMVNTAAPQ